MNEERINGLNQNSDSTFESDREKRIEKIKSRIKDEEDSIMKFLDFILVRYRSSENDKKRIEEYQKKIDEIESKIYENEKSDTNIDYSYLIDTYKKSIEKYKNFISDDRNSIESINKEIIRYLGYIDYSKQAIQTLKEELATLENGVVYGSVQADQDEPKSIVPLDEKQSIVKNTMYGTDEDVVDNFKLADYKKEDPEKAEEDRSKYIPGTNIEKPRDRYLGETDEHYVEFLRDYYSKYFPETKGLAVSSNEEKGIVPFGAYKDDSITQLKDSLNALKNVQEKEDIKKDDNDIDNYDVDGAPVVGGDEYENGEVIDANENPEVLDIDDDKDENLEVMENLTDEDLEKLEKSKETDYQKDKEKKSKKIGRIRLAATKIKDFFKKHKKTSIIAGVLVGTAALASVIGFNSASKDKTKDLNDNKDNTKSNVDMFDATIPSTAVADSYGVSSDDILNKVNQEKNNNKSDINTNESYSSSSDSYDVNFNIGEPVRFDGDKIYTNSKDANEEEFGLTPLFPDSDKREISAIQYVNDDGTKYFTATSKEEQKIAESLGFKKVESYNMKNVDHNTQYEGWVNTDDIVKAK